MNVETPLSVAFVWPSPRVVYNERSYLKQRKGSFVREGLHASQKALEDALASRTFKHEELAPISHTLLFERCPLHKGKCARVHTSARDKKMEEGG